MNTPAIRLLFILTLAAGLSCLTLSASPQSLRQGRIENIAAVAAGQRCQNWCWAAATEMLARSQGLAIPQEEFVRRIYGKSLPCLTSYGSFEPIRKAIAGTYKLDDESSIELSGLYHYGMPTNAHGMIQSIQEGRPFVFAWKGHALVAYGIDWVQTGPASVQITEIHLLDPLFTFGAPMYTSFKVGRDRFADINGTFELIVRHPDRTTSSVAGTTKSTAKERLDRVLPTATGNFSERLNRVLSSAPTFQALRTSNSSSDDISFDASVVLPGARLCLVYRAAEPFYECSLEGSGNDQQAALAAFNAAVERTKPSVTDWKQSLADPPLGRCEANFIASEPTEPYREVEVSVCPFGATPYRLIVQVRTR